MRGRGHDHEGGRRLLAYPGIHTCLEALRAQGEETRLVGGCVRDALLGLPIADIDLATTLAPEATMARARAAGLKAVPTGLDHGTITVVVQGAPFEVTTLREDVETDGRHARVRFGRDFTRDAERRDFTINALSLDAGGHLHDVTGGLADLAAGRVRFIGDPATRIAEDGLRIMRFFRFSARYAREHPDGPGLSACVAARGALARLSPERIRVEFLKLLAAPRAGAILAVLSDTGLLARIVGGVGERERFRKAAMADAAPIDRLAALCVRVGEDADRLRVRLHLSNAEHAGLSAYAAALSAWSGRAQVDARSARGLAAEHGVDAVTAVWRTTRDEPRPRVEPEVGPVLDAMRQKAGALILPVSGADLVARGVPPGPAIGRGLSAARQRWLDEGCPDDAHTRDVLVALALAAAHEPV